DVIREFHVTGVQTCVLPILLIPLAAFLSYWVFRKQLHNYYEHIIINSYLYSFWAICTGLVLYPIIYFLKSPEWIVYLTFISMPRSEERRVGTYTIVRMFQQH